MTALLRSLDPLVAALRADGYRVVGPTRSGETFVLADVDSAAGLPYGWTALVPPGQWRIAGGAADRPLALFGVRPCDLHAIDTAAGGRPGAAFVVAVNCLRAGPVCRCAPAGGGPWARDGYDLRVTELPGRRFVVEDGSPAGRAVLDALGAPPAGAAEQETAHAGVARLADAMRAPAPGVAGAAGLARSLPAPAGGEEDHAAATAGAGRPRGRLGA